MEDKDNKKKVYPGAPLPNADSIRLVKIHGSRNESQPIECTLDVVDLSNKPEFSALSYTWDAALHSFGEYVPDTRSGEPVHEIILCGKPFTVTDNLFDGLRELRRSLMTDPLWIDAICISQHDVSERAQQVANMGRIYGAAEEVIVWLGRDETDLEEIMWATEFLLADIRWRPTEFLTPRGSGNKDVAVLQPKVLGAMRFLAVRRWFSRAWIVQEVALSRAVRVICGRSEISWEALAVLLRLLPVTEWGSTFEMLQDKQRQDAYQTALRGVQKFEDIRDFLRAYGLPSIRVVPDNKRPGLKMHPGDFFGHETELERAAAWLAYLVAFVREQDCAIKHDKVYSVLGIAECFSNHVKDLVRPDYSLSVPEVYRMTTASLILHNRYLSVLGYVGDIGAQSITDLPSWVADYSALPGLGPLTTFIVSTEYGFDASAARSSKRFPRSIQGCKLSVFGAPFDKISHVMTQSMTNAVGDCEIEEFVAFGGSLPAQYVSGEKIVDVLWRTFLLDMGQSNDSSQIESAEICPAPNSYRQSFRAWFIFKCVLWATTHIEDEGASAPDPAISFLCQLFDAEARSRLVTNDLKQALIHLFATQTRLRGGAEAVDRYRQEALPFDRASFSKIRGRRLFKTENDFIGMGTLSIQPGDQVWLIRDSLVPLVLRPASDSGTFRLVGEAYLHGFMHGEMLEPRWGMEGKTGVVTII
jgi:hypothetical protein